MDLIFREWCEKNNVSCETVALLNRYLTILQKWNKGINLVSRSAFSEIWSRHILDSVSLLSHVKPPLVDVGSGAGFPGIILAIFNIQEITLIEANTKKAIFLNHIVRELALTANVTVINERVENISISTNTVVSRACAKLDKFLDLVDHWQYQNILLLKGPSYLEEIQVAQQNWQFTYNTYLGSDPKSVILSITEAKKSHA